MAVHKLTSKQVEHAKEGTHGDGGGLSLRVRGGSKNWVFRSTLGGKVFEMGLGSLSLAEARTRAAECREAVKAGRDPRAIQSENFSDYSGQGLPTFSTAMDRYLDMRSAEWSNAKHAKQWRSTLERYASSLMQMAVEDIQTRHVAACLAPIWHTKGETASRVRQRIERILSASIAMGERDGPNPAAWPDNLQLVLGPQKRQVKHHSAVPVSEAPAAFTRLWSARQTGQGARGALLVALTGLRSGEVRHLHWDDITDDTITIPAERMKARREHRVPVTPRVAELLDSIERWNSPLVLPSSKLGPISDMTLAAAHKRNDLGAYTVHGWRSVFSDWAHESGWNHRWVEDQLAHQIGTDVERAYRRGDYLTQRKPMMIEWENYLCSQLNN